MSNLDEIDDPLEIEETVNDVDADTENEETDNELEKPKKPKRVLSLKQREALKLGRAKAHAKHRERIKKVKEIDALKQLEPVPEALEEDDVIVYKKKPKKKPIKQKIVYVSAGESDDSSDEEYAKVAPIRRPKFTKSLIFK